MRKIIKNILTTCIGIVCCIIYTTPIPDTTVKMVTTYKVIQESSEKMKIKDKKELHFNATLDKLKFVNSQEDVKIKEIIYKSKKISEEMDVNFYLMIAQFMIESNFSRSNLAVNHNNLFGLTASETYRKNPNNKYYKTVIHDYNKEGKKVEMVQYFRKYNTVDDCLMDYAKIIKQHYDGGYNISKLKKYCADPNYIKMVTKVMIKYQNTFKE